MNQGRDWLSKELLNLDNIKYLGLEYIDTSQQELINTLNIINWQYILKEYIKIFQDFLQILL